MSSTRIDAAPYGAAASALAGVSRGTYPGPAVQEEILRAALGSVTGLDTSALTSGFSQASGESQPGHLHNRVAPVAIKILGDVALGLIGGLVGDVVGDWVNRREETKDLEDHAKDAADAVDTVVEDADNAMSEVLNRAMQLLDMLLKYISGIDPGQFPREFLAAVSCAAEIIDNAAEMILGTCEQRDEIIEGCYGQLISEAEKICGEPAAELPPEIKECTKEVAPVDVPASGARSDTPTEPDAKMEECPPVTQPNNTTPEPEVTHPEVKPEPKPELKSVPPPEPAEDECPPELAPTPDPVTTPSGIAPEVQSDPVPEPELPIKPEEPVEPNSVEETPTNESAETPGDDPEQAEGCGDICGGILGLVGVGVALLALGALVECLTEMEIPAVESTPAPIPEPAPAQVTPAGEEVPAPAPAPSVEELAEVPEPAPPPKKVVFTEAQQVAPAPPPPPAPAPAPAPPPPPAPVPASVGTARKAGAW